MSFSIPSALKDLNALGYTELLPVELNDIDVDRLMTQVLERAVKHGRTAASKTDPRAYSAQLEKLAGRADVAGLPDERRLQVLDGWLRSAVVRTGRAGLTRAVAQMDYVHPLTIAVYRSGLPKSRSRHRKADEITFIALRKEIASRGSHTPERDLADIFQRAFGDGVNVGVNPWSEPRYDEASDVDVSVLLTLRFLEGFDGNANLGRQPAAAELAVPGSIRPLARDLLDYLQLYGRSLSPAEVSQHLAGLLSLRLFQLPLRTAGAVRTMLVSGELPPDMTDGDAPNPLEIYCDFTRRRGGPSDEIARQCVQRDLDVMRQFFADRLLLRSLNQVIPLLGASAGDLASQPIGVRLCALAGLRTDDRIEMALGMLLLNIESQLPPGEEGEDGRALIFSVRSSGLPIADQLTAVLVEGLRKRGLENQVKWFWSTGGIVKPYGVLQGTRSVRSSWRYAPGDELLTAMLMVCFAEAAGTRTRETLPIADLLHRLESRFGVIIDRPPGFLDNADARGGAVENLEAFTRTLQLLGCFNSMSDDFSAQSVSRPRKAEA